jgi:hypothetical protein
MSQVLQSLGLYGAEYNRKANAYVAANPDSGFTGGGSYGVIGTEIFRTTDPTTAILPPVP